MSQNRQSKERLAELDLVRAFAILGVLTVHATSFATLEMKIYDSYPIYNALNIFMKFGTTTFIFLSSFVLFLNYYNSPMTKSLLKTFYKRRLMLIIVPYLLFSVIYYTVVLLTHYQGETAGEVVSGFLTKVLTGDAYTHLYFVFISAQFYLLFPVVLFAMKRWPVLVSWAIPIGFAVQWGFRVVDDYVNIPSVGSWSLSYFSYYLLGAWMGIRYQKVRGWLEVVKGYHSSGRYKKLSLKLLVLFLWLSSSAAHIYIWYNFRLYGTKYDMLLYNALWSIHTFTTALVLLQLSYISYTHLSARFIYLFHRLGELAFGIYLLHPLFLALYREFRPATDIEALLHVWYLGGFAFALFGSSLTVSLASRFLPYYWVIFGRVKRSEAA
ncbi:acyltransferase [Paenibacillus alkaliterrae]|uniref:acyltransferase n=1 Tax=Paenibacillus alkaliterrae TaxID=320909 RepID=UPI001F4478AB|nr:acyltransferase [Paenibacillus alkaliterrae]MCF2939574.1 acyltransferase [Paenibacillus alkaliterrae]